MLANSLAFAAVEWSIPFGVEARLDRKSRVDLLVARKVFIFRLRLIILENNA